VGEREVDAVCEEVLVRSGSVVFAFEGVVEGWDVS